MAGPPPRPPWFRMPSIVIRPPAPAPAPPPAPVTTLMRPPVILTRPSIPAIQPQVIATLPQVAAQPPLVTTASQLVPTAPLPGPIAPLPGPTTAVLPGPNTSSLTGPTARQSVPTAVSPAPPSSPLVRVAMPPVTTPLLNNSQPKSPTVINPPTVVATPPPSPAARSAPPPTPPLVPPRSPTTPPATKSPPPTSSRGGSPLVKNHSPSLTKQPASPAGEIISEKANSPIPSHELVKSLKKNTPFSPKVQALSYPPSPLTLPPARSRTEAITEQKNLLVQPTIDKPMETPRDHSNGVASNEKKDPRTKEKGPSISKKHPSPEERGLRVIAIAGENRGAVMELSSRHTKRSALGTNGNQSGSENGEKSGNKDKTNKSNASQPPVTTALLNSNVQGLNNSILYNCSFRNNDPGVHLSIKRASNGRRSKE